MGRSRLRRLLRSRRPSVRPDNLAASLLGAAHSTLPKSCSPAPALTTRIHATHGAQASSESGDEHAVAEVRDVIDHPRRDVDQVPAGVRRPRLVALARARPAGRPPSARSPPAARPERQRHLLVCLARAAHVSRSRVRGVEHSISPISFSTQNSAWPGELVSRIPYQRLPFCFASGARHPQCPAGQPRGSALRSCADRADRADHIRHHPESCSPVPHGPRALSPDENNRTASQPVRNLSPSCAADDASSSSRVERSLRRGAVRAAISPEMIRARVPQIVER